MKKVIPILFIACLFFAVGLVSATQETCEAADGNWITFNNGCADSCNYIRSLGTDNPLLCTQATTDGCDCGEAMCWNGTACEYNELPQLDDSVIPNGEVNETTERICCKIYGYGAQMREVNIHYEFTQEERCSVPENFVGGNREIVNNSYCKKTTQPEPKQLTEKEKIKMQNVIQTRNRLHHMIQEANGTCPDNCTCTGSAMKCMTQDGNREMIIRAGKSGNTIIQVKNVNMSTRVALFKADDGGVFGVFKGNQTKKIILPDVASEAVKQKLQERISEKQRERKKIFLEEENVTLDEEGNYNIQARKKARLFWVIPIKEKVRTQVDAETGEVIKQRHSWWGFLARDVRENIPVEDTE